MKTCFIVRGVSGSGKSTLSKSLAEKYSAVICSADDFHMVDGEYKFDYRKLAQAHEECYQKFCEAVFAGDNVIIDNTNTTEAQYQKYLDWAKNNGYQCFVVIAEPHQNQESIHGVDDVVLTGQKNKLLGSLEDSIRKMLTSKFDL